MKWNFAIIRIAHLVSFVWCGVGANTQNNGTMNNPSVSAAPTMQTMTEPINDGSPKLKLGLSLIISCVAAAVAILAGLIAIMWLYSSRRQKTKQKRKLSKENVNNAEARISLFYSTTDNSSTNLSCPDSVEKIITTDGGVITLDNFTLKIGPGCLADDTKITLRKDDQYVATKCKSLLDLGLLHAIPQVVRFLPDNLKFLKPADLTITTETMADCEFEIFILHGFDNPHNQTTVWELVTNGIEQNNVDGLVTVKINGFCLFTYILATRGWIARILSHFNHSFTCRAHPFYRRVSSGDAIDISIVLVSDFVEDDHGENIKQIRDLCELGYVKGEKGLLKPVCTNCSLEMCVNFPDVESSSFLFKIDEGQLDSAIGYVVDQFKGISMKSPVNGVLRIDEVHEDAPNKSLWVLNISENIQEIEPLPPVEQYSAPEGVVYRTTKLTNREMDEIVRDLGINWEKLAGLMDIPYSQQEEIRANPNILRSKGKRIFELYNASKHFDRRVLVKYFEELGQHVLKKKMLPMEDENWNEEVENEVQLQNNTPLSAREMCRLSQRLVGDSWYTLAALLGISTAERDDIRYSLLYNTSHSKAVKMLAIFNDMEDFSRQTLTECLEEIGQVELKEPVITGEWRR